jgi:RNA polymerase sigma factor (sigma-70 family)
MQTKSDIQLLREYGEGRNEAAFTEIVARHTDLVYSAALRQVNCPEVARDVVQGVFAALARAARALCKGRDEHASLAGWLYRSTRNISLKLRRDQFRRQSRERQTMQEFEHVAEIVPDWDRLRPVLDEAMSGLGDADHDALVLRYFRNQDLRAVGTALGVSEDAAQKRVSRALERLRSEFKRRGVSTTAEALTAGVSANAITAAPAGLAASAAAAALASSTMGAGTALGTPRLMAMTTPTIRVGVACAVVTSALLIPLLLQRHAINTLQRANVRLRHQGRQTIGLSNEHNWPGQFVAGATSLSEPKRELLKLRGQVGLLRQELAALKAGETRFANPAAWLVNSNAPRLSADQAESYLKRHGRKPACLLAAYYSSRSETYLREAMENYPDDARVAFAAAAHSGPVPPPRTSDPDDARVALAAAAAAKAQGQPEEYRQWLGRFEAAAPENGLPNYLLAADYMDAGLTNQGLRELQAATGKSKLALYSLDLAQSCEEAYLSAGYSELEAEAAGIANTPKLSLLPFSDLKRKLIGLADSYRQTGDAASAQAVLEMGLTLGQRFAEPSPMATIVETLWGASAEGAMLERMDPDSRVGSTELAAQAQLDEISAAYTRMREENVKELMRSIPLEDQPGYLDRLKATGQLAALQWLVSRQSQPPPH